MPFFDDIFRRERGEKGKMNQLENEEEYQHTERWNEGIENHEKLKRLLPFMNEDEGYL